MRTKVTRFQIRGDGIQVGERRGSRDASLELGCFVVDDRWRRIGQRFDRVVLLPSAGLRQLDRQWFAAG